MSLVVSSNLLITNNLLSLSTNNKFKHKLLSLQKRIYKAAASNDYKRMHKLQKLLLSSNYSKLVAILIIIKKYLKVSNLLLNKSNVTNPNLSIKQLLNLVTSQTVIKNLHYKTDHNLIYFCLKPEWEAKFNLSKFNYIIKASYTNKLSLVSQICRKYSISTKKQHTYILQGTIDMLEILQCLNYFIGKLHTITQIKKLIRSHIHLHLNIKNNDLNSMTSQLSDLLINILMEDLGSLVCLKQQQFWDYISKIRNINLAEGFIWHNNSFVFISDSKNRVVFVKSQIKKFYNIIGLYKSIQNLQILKLQQGFSFLGFYIKSANYYKPTYYQSKIIITPSFESQLRLLKKIKKVLYHKDKFCRNRANTHLSIKFVIPKICCMLQQWKKYYYSNDLVNIAPLKKLNSIIQEIVYRWEIKKHKKKFRLKYKDSIRKILLINLD